MLHGYYAVTVTKLADLCDHMASAAVNYAVLSLRVTLSVLPIRERRMAPKGHISNLTAPFSAGSSRGELLAQFQPDTNVSATFERRLRLPFSDARRRCAPRRFISQNRSSAAR